MEVIGKQREIDDAVFSERLRVLGMVEGAYQDNPTDDLFILKDQLTEDMVALGKELGRVTERTTGGSLLALFSSGCCARSINDQITVL